jgi:thiamine-phosphate diphosphorylase
VTALADRGRPLLAVVTDRGRLAPGISSVEQMLTCVLNQAREAIAAGVDFFQIRERDLEASTLYALVAAAAELADRSQTKVIVNDRVDVALAAHAHGVHLRADSPPAMAVRAIVPSDFLIGQSVHDAIEAADRSRDVDYLIAGTVFDSVSKPGRTPIGLEGLAAIVRRVEVPVLAIGGVSLARARAVAHAGAAGIAGVGLFLGPAARADARGCRAVPLVDVTASLRAQFDTSGRPS